MRLTPANLDDGACRRAIERLEALPIRPTVARQVFAVLTDDLDPDAPVCASNAGALALGTTETDPAWALSRSRSTPEGFDPTLLVIESPWWAATPSPSAIEALIRLWRHSVAVAFAARRLAREANDTEVDRIGRAGLLHLLGLWALAAVDLDRLVAWVQADPAGRRAFEIRWFGVPIATVGKRLAERWRLDPLVSDSAWLHADLGGDLNACAADPNRLALIQAAYAQARRTPWSLDPDPARDFGPTDPRVRILTAEVQSRCGAPFVDPDSTAREEALTRDNLRLRRALAESVATASSATRLVATLAAASPHEPPQAWADRAALALCHEPGVASARMVWRLDQAITEPTTDRPPSLVLPIGNRANPVADLMIWSAPGQEAAAPSPTVLDGWSAWARLVADRERLVQTLDQAVTVHRDRVARDLAGQRRSSLATLAEFAAGAGHELNNPLAVIMGRAQLVLARTTDPDATRSLRAIITQVQRAHRILRDLMFVARPSDFRPRACQPDEIVRASLRDLQAEADSQGVRLVLDARDVAPPVWLDPEPLRQVADILTRNALEASEAGATIRFSTVADARQLKWTVHDAGRGISATEGAHLFDPFYCGRQAGRGLGLGLPRAARIIDQVGGEIRWHSTPGQGATFQVTLPVREVPLVGDNSG